MDMQKELENILENMSKENTEEFFLNLTNDNSLESEINENKLDIQVSLNKIQFYIDQTNNLDDLKESFNGISVNLEMLFYKSELNLDKLIKNSLVLKDDEMYKTLIHFKNQKIQIKK